MQMNMSLLQDRFNLRALRSACGLAVAGAACLLATGCGVQVADIASTPIATQGVAFKGDVHGGQQPVSGSTIQLYAASTAGYGAPSYALLTTPVTSDANGNFSITGAYNCPSSTSLVYVTATGGNSGSGNNANLAMMTALGACGNLAASTYISINEITTVASVYALSPFMTAIGSVGTSATNVTGLTNAFASVNKLSNITTGSSAGTLPTGATAPATEINTLADIIAACINTTGGTASNTGTNCGKLFSYTTPTGGTAPTDTIAAAVNIAKYPGNNVSSLLSLVQPASPFQPTLTSAADFTVTIKYKPTASSPSALAINAGGDVWVTNAGNNTVSALNGGTGVANIYSGGGLSGPSAIAFDASGNAFVPNKTSSTLTTISSAGVVAQSPLVSLNAPTGIALDGAGIVFITNSGNSTVTTATFNGVNVATSNVYSGAGVNTPKALAINPY